MLATAGSCLFSLFGVLRQPRQILIVRGRNWSTSIPKVDVLLFVVSFPSEEWRNIGGTVSAPYIVAVVIHHFDVGRAAERARKKLRTRRGWAIAARCVFGVVCHFIVWLSYRSSLSAAMPSHERSRNQTDQSVGTIS